MSSKKKHVVLRNGYAEIPILLGLMLFAFVLTGGINQGLIQGGIPIPTPIPPPAVTLMPPSQISAQSSLQLSALEPFTGITSIPLPTQHVTITGIPTRPPSPSHSCSQPAPQPVKKGKCISDGPVNSCSDCCKGANCGAYTAATKDCPSQYHPNWCDAEPILYLYPQVPTTVSVMLSVPGQISESTPLYPPGGWNNILAFPDRTFLYHGHLYNELYYETAISPGTPPTRGIVVPRLDISKTVLQLITKLGLQPKEQDEFMQYWMKRLNTLSSPYLFISVFSPEEKEKIDRVTITPTPDTFIQFNFYFKPVSTFFSPPPLFLPSAPARKGFVVVEWGGILDKN